LGLNYPMSTIDLDCEVWAFTVCALPTNQVAIISLQGKDCEIAISLPNYSLFPPSVDFSILISVGILAVPVTMSQMNPTWQSCAVLQVWV